MLTPGKSPASGTGARPPLTAQEGFSGLWGGSDPPSATARSWEREQATSPERQKPRPGTACTSHRRRPEWSPQCGSMLGAASVC